MTTPTTQPPSPAVARVMALIEEYGAACANEIGAGEQGPYREVLENRALQKMLRKDIRAELHRALAVVEAVMATFDAKDALREAKRQHNSQFSEDDEFHPSVEVESLRTVANKAQRQLRRQLAAYRDPIAAGAEPGGECDE